MQNSTFISDSILKKSSETFKLQDIDEIREETNEKEKTPSSKLSNPVKIEF